MSEVEGLPHCPVCGAAETEVHEQVAGGYTHWFLLCPICHTSTRLYDEIGDAESEWRPCDVSGQSDTLKLYRVNLRGLSGGVRGQTDHSTNYVVAGSTDQAYQMVKGFFDLKKQGFQWERELNSVELVAEAKSSPLCGTMLFLQGESSSV